MADKQIRIRVRARSPLQLGRLTKLVATQARSAGKRPGGAATKTKPDGTS
jgi:hypothetical protein